MLTTPGLAEFKRLVEQARREHGEITRELVGAHTQEQRSVGKYTRWNNGWVLRRIFQTRFQQLAATAEEAVARREELQEQEGLARLNTQIEMPKIVSQAFHRMCDEFSLLAKSARIWDTVGQRRTNRIAERTTATRTIAREPVSFRVGKCDVIESEWNVPHLANANGGDIFFYPAFVLYFISPEAFALLEYKEVDLTYSPTGFIETGTVPPDSKVVGQTWVKTNKDGSPDRRFKGNYQIPVVQYGEFVFKSTTGMNEEYMVSNAGQAEAFNKSWKHFVDAVRSVA